MQPAMSGGSSKKTMSGGTHCPWRPTRATPAKMVSVIKKSDY
jgi:hypothetical protein